MGLRTNLVLITTWSLNSTRACAFTDPQCESETIEDEFLNVSKEESRFLGSVWMLLLKFPPELEMGSAQTFNSPTRLGLIDRKFTEVINPRARAVAVVVAVEGLQTT